MNDKKNFVILLVIMVALIGGAYGLYSMLSDKVERQGLAVQENSGGAMQNTEATQGGNAGMAQNGGSSQSGIAEGTSGTSQSSTAEGTSGTSQSNTAESTGSTTANPDSTTQSTGNGAETGKEAQTQELAPDFTVYDVEGNAYNLSDFRGKPVIVNFWASWCGPCKSEMPDFQEVYDLYGEKIHFLMVNMTDGAQETVESASAFIGESGYTFPIYYDTDMDAAYTYGVYSIPTTYFFDAEGYCIAYGSGALDRETIQTGIDMIYSE